MKSAAPKLIEILKAKNLSPEKIKFWALHPGGRAILDALKQGLNINEDKMIPSRNVLRDFGNMSSASILFVIKEIIDNNKVEKNDYCCAVAFGPGLTMEVALFKGA